MGNSKIKSSILKCKYCCEITHTWLVMNHRFFTDWLLAKLHYSRIAVTCACLKYFSGKQGLQNTGIYKYSNIHLCKGRGENDVRFLLLTEIPDISCMKNRAWRNMSSRATKDQASWPGSYFQIQMASIAPGSILAMESFDWRSRLATFKSKSVEWWTVREKIQNKLNT